MSAIASCSRLLLCRILWLWMLPFFSHAQTQEVNAPESPPRDYLYHASEGNLYFEKYQAQELSDELKRFHQETGFTVYVVTVNSPPKKIMDNLRQQIETKWQKSRDCLVIYYDLDTSMLAVKFEQFYEDQSGLMIPSQLLGVPEQAWITHVDQWMKSHEQMDGIEISQALPFFKDFLAFMRAELANISVRKPVSDIWYGVVVGLIVVAFLGYWWLQKFARKFASDVEYHFPSLPLNQRLKARFGGGMLTVRQMTPRRSSRS